MTKVQHNAAMLCNTNENELASTSRFEFVDQVIHIRMGYRLKVIGI